MWQLRLSYRGVLVVRKALLAQLWAEAWRCEMATAVPIFCSWPGRVGVYERVRLTLAGLDTEFWQLAFDGGRQMRLAILGR